MKASVNEKTKEKFRKATEKSKLKGKLTKGNPDIQLTSTEWSEEAVQIANEAYKEK